MSISAFICYYLIKKGCDRDVGLLPINQQITYERACYLTINQYI